MNFKVGTFDYVIKIVPAPLMYEGQERAGLHVWAGQEILISSKVPVRQRLDVLLHELRHAWKEHMGCPIDAEDDANNAASYAMMVIRGLQVVGGEPALWRLGIGGVLSDENAPWDMPTQSYGCQCPTCQTVYGNHQIHISPPKYREEWGRIAVDCACPCGHCNKQFVWLEGATKAGLRNGRILVPPKLIASGDLVASP